MAVTRIDRITRIKMLLTSYLDAHPAPPSNTGERTTGSRERSMPDMPLLWRQGSYHELEEALEALGQMSYQRLYRAFVWQPDRRRRSVQLIYRQKAAKKLAGDLELVSRSMPRRIRVPLVVIENWKDGLNTQFHRPSKSTDSPVRSDEDKVVP